MSEKDRIDAKLLHYFSEMKFDIVGMGFRKTIFNTVLLIIQSSAEKRN